MLTKTDGPATGHTPWTWLSCARFAASVAMLLAAQYVSKSGGWYRSLPPGSLSSLENHGLLKPPLLAAVVKPAVVVQKGVRRHLHRPALPRTLEPIPNTRTALTTPSGSKRSSPSTVKMDTAASYVASTIIIVCHSTADSNAIVWN